MTIHGVTWIVIRNGCVCLEKCPKKAQILGVGEWFVPGGKIEPGESPDDALLRELHEEWPWFELSSIAALPIIEGSPVPPGPRGLFLMRPYLVRAAAESVNDWRWESTSAEGTPLCWVSLLEALASPVPQVRMMVAAAAGFR